MKKVVLYTGGMWSAIVCNDRAAKKIVDDFSSGRWAKDKIEYFHGSWSDKGVTTDKYFRADAITAIEVTPV